MRCELALQVDQCNITLTLVNNGSDVKPRLPSAVVVLIQLTITRCSTCSFEHYMDVISVTNGKPCAICKFDAALSRLVDRTVPPLPVSLKTSAVGFPFVSGRIKHSRAARNVNPPMRAKGSTGCTRISWTMKGAAAAPIRQTTDTSPMPLLLEINTTQFLEINKTCGSREEKSGEWQRE